MLSGLSSSQGSKNLFSSIKDVKIKNLMKSIDNTNFVKTLLNFDKFATSHSPIYYIYVLFLEKISFNETFSRLINLHISLLIPYFFYLCLNGI